MYLLEGIITLVKIEINTMITTNATPIKNISNYKSDEVAYINYKIKINDKEYIVSQREKNELREFIDSINGDELLWCE